MRRLTPVLATAVAVSVVLTGALVASADVITSPADSYTVDYTPDDGVAPLTAAEFPDAQAQNVLDAMSNADPVTAGTPNGYHNGYLGLGFDEPDFDGSPRRTYVRDCSSSGGCDSGNAPRNRINLPAAMYRTQSEACVRAVIGHELFHHVEYESIDFDHWQTWGGDPVEGAARVLQDKVYSDLDSAITAGCPGDFLAEVNGYLSSPGITLLGRSYGTALFWQYLMERLGTQTAEPGAGADFMAAFWANAQAAGSHRDFVGTLRTTISQFDDAATLEGLFQDFTIANYTKRKDVSALADGADYRYRDEQQPGATAYASVPADLVTIPPTAGPTSMTVNRWATKYVEANLADCTGVAGFVADGDRAGFALVSQKDSAVTRIDRAVTDHFATSVLVRAKATGSKRITRLGAVITALGDQATTSYRFACGQYGLDIKDPTTANPAHVGTKSEPNRFIVRVSVSGPAELGTPSVEGLRPEDFTATVGGSAATVLSGAYVQGEYWLTVQPPTKGAAEPDLHDLTVNLGDVADTETDAVSYTVRRLDQMLTVDRSGSMTSPASSPKIVAAQNAASLYVDVAREDDKLGVVSFNGDNSEVNDDATLDALLSTMSDANRATARAKVLGLVASGMTSIGDGVAKSAAEYPIRGTALGEDHIVLLSDGMENEGRYWSNVRASVVGAGVRVDTIALGPLTDQALLQQIASDTGGTYYYVDVASGVAPAPSARTRSSAGATAPAPGASLSNTLARAYFAANEDAGQLERFWQHGDVAAAGSTSSRTFTLDEDGMTDAVLAVNWPDSANPLRISVTGPSGVLADGVDGVAVEETATHAVFRIPKMERGAWSVEVRGSGADVPWVGLGAGRPAFGTSMWTVVGDRHEYRKESDAHRWGEQIPIVANLTDRAGGIRRATVSATVTHPDGTDTVLPLLDDGNHGDGQADDGVYAATYTATTAYAARGADDPSPKPNGSYQVLVTAAGRNSLGEDYVRYDQKSFAVFEDREAQTDRDGDTMADLYEGYHACVDPTGDDTGKDPDEDGLDTGKEWLIGTDPCHADTDRGGEPDGSEVSRGSNPFDPGDDALPRPEDPSVVDRPLDHLPRPALRPNSLLIRYPAHPSYSTINLYRSTSAAGPFSLVRTFDSTANGGLFRDTGLTNLTTYYYRLEGVTAAGYPSRTSPVFSGMPRKEPMPPIGQVEINGGRPYAGSTSVTLGLTVDDKDVVSVMVSNRPGFVGATWQPMVASKPWVVAPDAAGYATVYVRYKDKAGNVSNSVNDSVTVRAGLVTHSGVVAPVTPPADGTLDGIWLSIVGQPSLPMAVTDAAGRFSFVDVPPGSYSVTALGAGYSTTRPVPLKPAGTRTTVRVVP